MNIIARRGAFVGKIVLVALVVTLTVVIYKMLDGSYGHQPSQAELKQMHQDWSDLQGDARQICELRKQAIVSNPHSVQDEQNAERSYTNAASDYTYTWQWYKQQPDIGVVAPPLENMVKLAC